MTMGKRFFWLAVVAAIFAGSAIARAVPRPPPTPGLLWQPISVGYREAASGFVSPKFHARRAGNRVFYAGSLKAARPWLPFTGLKFKGLDFSRYGLLAIFYQPSPGYLANVSSIGADPRSPSTLLIKIQIHPFCTVDPVLGATTCFALAVPSWGRFTLVLIDKATLPGLPERLYVTESN